MRVKDIIRATVRKCCTMLQIIFHSFTILFKMTKKHQGKKNNFIVISIVFIKY